MPVCRLENAGHRLAVALRQSFVSRLSRVDQRSRQVSGYYLSIIIFFR